MKLSKLEIIGFKSFPAKTTFEFDSGIVGIVGPNGCGKTNVLEAIEWVLGEQNPFNLRGEKMEDFIFKGSENHKPLNFAEVTAVIENDGLLPISYEEVAITRRFYRSGESEYFINRTNVRLKDIVNLFLNTGLKAEAYSIFRREMIETILSSNSKARRNLFEEAAEIAKYKTHKKTTLGKLELIKTDLIRVNDILLEVERQWRSLKRQERRSRKYKELNEELKAKRVMLSYLDYEMLSKELRRIEKEMELQNRAREEQLELMEFSEAKLGKEITRMQALDEDINHLREEDNGIREEMRKVSENLIAHAERRKSILSQKEYIEKDKDLIIEKIPEIQALIDKEKQEEAKRTEEISSMEKKNSNLKDKVSSLEKEYVNKKSDFEDARLRKQKIENSMKILKEKQISQTADSKNREEFLATLSLELSDLQGENRKIKEVLAELESELSRKKEREEQTREKVAKEREYWEKFEERKRNKESEFIHLNERESILGAEADFLGSFKKDRKGYNELVKSLRKEHSLSILADILEVSLDMKEALAGALEAFIQTVVLTEEKKLNDVLGMAQEKDMRIGVLLAFMDTESVKTIKDKRVLGQLSDFLKVKVGGKTGEVIANFFSKFFLCSSINDCLELYNKYPEYSFVTPKGDVLSGGILFVGKGAHRELIGLGERIRKNIEEMKRVGNLKEEKSAEKSKIEEQQEKVSKRLKELGIELTKHVSELKESELDFEKKRFESEMNKKRIKKLENEVRDARRNLNTLKDNVLNDERIYRQENTGFNNVLKNAIEKEKAFRESEVQLYALRDRGNKTEIILTRLKGEGRAREEILNAKEKELEDIKRKMDEGNLRVKSLEEELDKVAEKEAVLTSEKANIDEKEKRLGEQLNRVKEEKDTAKEKIDELEEKKEEMAARDKVLYEQYSDLSIEKVKADAERRNTIERIREEYGVDIENYDGKVTLFEKEKFSEELEILQERKRKFGPVNLMAIEDLTRVESRRTDLITQKTDLLEARKDLITTIEHIDSVAKEKFLTTFSEVKENFKVIFNKLFESGECDLLLSGSDPLEADITIVAKPKHKKVGGLASLSTGERTLIAISLLFAFYLIKPSPICVLDEIDAPLDDANVERFISLLGEFKERSQLIVITHNKATMKCADYLYGITMNEPNVSTVASVKIS